MLSHLNGFDPSLQFTCEQQTDQATLSFLDLKLTKLSTGFIFNHFIKPTQTTRTIPYNSAHPPSTLRAIVISELTRSLNHCSTELGKNEQKCRIWNKYLANGYPPNLLHQLITKWRPKEPNSLTSTKTKQEFIDSVTIPYISPLFHTLSARLMKEGIRVTFRPISTLKQQLMGPRSNSTQTATDHYEQCKIKRDVVYQIPCASCDAVYIGQTGRPLGRRIKEHEAAVRRNDTNNGLALHYTTQQHSPDWNSAKILFQEKNTAVRLQLEGLAIQAKHGSTLNISPPNFILKSWIEWLARFDVSVT